MLEKHYASGDGKGRRSLNPTTKVFLSEGASANMELTQIAGVDEANRINEAVLGSRQSFIDYGKSFNGW
jgi:hypothetical protein